jgi:hypothetical protein
MSGRLLPALALAAVSALSLSPAPALALDRTNPDERDTDRQGWIVPDFAKLQTAGYAGLIAVGLGYAGTDDIVNLSVAYGYTPELMVGAEVHTVGVTLSVRPFEIDFRNRARFIPVYAGAGLLFVLGDTYFMTVPERYPGRLYYPPTAVHWTLHAGTELDVLPEQGGVFERHGFYAEVVALDSFLIAYAENPNEVELEEVLSLALGYRASW